MTRTILITLYILAGLCAYWDYELDHRATVYNVSCSSRMKLPALGLKASKKDDNLSVAAMTKENAKKIIYLFSEGE